LLSVLQTAQAQFKLVSFGMNSAYEEDRVKGLSSNDMITAGGLTVPEGLESFSDRGEAISTFWENPSKSMRVDIAFQKLEMEFRLGVFGNFDRSDVISFEGEGEDIFLEYSSDEIGIDVLYLQRSNTVCGWHIYGGVGGQLGYGYRNFLYGYGTSKEIIAERSSSDVNGRIETRPSNGDDPAYFDFSIRSDSPNTLHARSFVTGGASFNLDKLELSIEGRWGYGLRHSKYSNFTTNLRSLSVGVRHNLQRPGPCGKS